MAEIFDYTSNYAYTVFRGINQARQFAHISNSSTAIVDAAKNFSEDDKCELTIALEDFSEKFTKFHGQNNSNISADDCKRKGFFAWLENIGWKKTTYENMYETPEMQEYMVNDGNIYQKDIFRQARTADDGIKFANSEADIYQSALNFARADIVAIEEANFHASLDAKKNGKLEKHEIMTYADKDKLFYNFMEQLDLDGDPKSITAEEYASFLIAADGCFADETNGMGRGYDKDSTDGLITNDEALVFKNYSNEEVRKFAQTIYDNHYRK